MAKNTIVDIHELARITSKAKAKGKVVVHCHGVFDLLHIGHIRYFKQAKNKGDLLVVTITPDKYVDKGSHRPAFPESLRLEAIASIYCVDYVALNEWPTAEETLRLIQPDIYVKGSEFKDITSDMTGKIGLEEKVIHEIGARLDFTEDIVFSSTHLINTYFSAFSKDVDDYLRLFRQRHKVDDVLETIDNMLSLKVAVVGDAILDEYVYCDAIGKSSKDPVLALKYQHEDRFAGGALAVANHVASFVEKVKLFTVIGSECSHEQFIRDSLAPNVSPHFFMRQGAPTLIKRRFVEGYSLNKLFELYVMGESDESEEASAQMSDALAKELKDFDLVLVADYGHGALTQKVIDVLVKNARFLAVNTQANAGNRGFNTISRYPKADYACIAEHEMRLETRDLQGDLVPMMHSLAPKLDASVFVVTRGRRGCFVRADTGGLIQVPAFDKRVIDRVGAGDAFLSVTSLAAALGVHPEILGFIGNVAGAEAVEIVGNNEFIDKTKLKKHIVSLLK
ncbi:PfkB family carbohydrate kinase [Verrucomicrobiota bacterium]